MPVNLTPNHSGKGNPEGFRRNRAVLSPAPPFRCGKGGTEAESGAVISFQLSTVGAGVTPAQGGAEPTVGSAFNRVIYPSLNSRPA
jgi:hypothetical protein